MSSGRCQLTETGCMVGLHYCADPLGDPDRKRCKREGLAVRGGGGGAGGGVNCHQREGSVWLCRQEPPSRAGTHTNASCNFFSPQKCLRHPRCAGKHPGGRSGFKGVDNNSHNWGNARDDADKLTPPATCEMVIDARQENLCSRKQI